MMNKFIKKLWRWIKDQWLIVLVTPKILIKWWSDRKILPLNQELWQIYRNIHISAYQKTSQFPNLIHPKTLNDIIDWSKLFAQDKIMVQCSDKIRVRDYISASVGEKYLCDLYQVHSSTKDIDFNTLPAQYVIKTNHDSGSVVVVSTNRDRPSEVSLSKLEQSLKKAYGWENGEWPYSYIAPKILVEEFISDPDYEIPPDYKVQCINGRVSHIRYTYDRQSNRKEIVLDPEGNRLDFIVDGTFNKTDDDWQMPTRWDEMIEISEKLASRFFMARVDFFCTKARLVIGEITFFPMGGHSIADGQEYVVKDVDITFPRPLPPIISELENSMPRNFTYKKRSIREKLLDL